MIDKNEKMTASIRLSRGEHEFLKDMGHGSFSKGFDLILEFYKENKKLDLGSIGQSSRGLLENLRGQIEDLERDFGGKDLFRKKINRYKEKLENLEKDHQKYRFEKMENVIDILERKFGNSKT